MQESLEASLVRIHTTDGHVVGAGFLVGERHILTCAHVISQALDLASSPFDPPPGVVSLDFPHFPPHTLLTARVVLWCPPLPDGSGDLAGLELEREPPTGAQKVRFVSAENVWKHDFSALGFPEDFDDGVWATGRLLRRQATNWIQIEDVKAQGFAVGPGFSGTPVWDEQLQGVVGMVVAASRPADTRTAFVIPLEVLAAAWPLLTVPEDQPRNPYKGLRPFTQRDAADFFGREAVVEKVVDLINSLATEQPAHSSTRMLTILGPSGVGKSSLLMAGLLPKLQQGALPESKDWVYLDPLVPGKRPLEALASILKSHFPYTSFKTLLEDLEDEAARGLHLLATQLAKQRGTRVVLLIDQFEELFTQTEIENERQRFIRLLLNACSESRGSVVVLLTLRADFYDRPMQYPELFRLIEAQHLSLLAIAPDDLRRVVEQPAALPDVQVTFEGDLVNRLLYEVQGQVGALPLLQFTLDQLFQRRSGRQLTLSTYRELGGVKGALTRRAEETYTALPSDEHRKLARALFVRLIDPGATEQDTTRRRAALSEFSLPEASQTRRLQEVADAFIAARLLTTNEIAGTTIIEVSHEALIREWPRLAAWLREARDDILLQQTISKDTTEWEQRNKPGDRLYRGSQLNEAQAWARRNTPSGNEVAFLRAGAARHIRSIASVTMIVLLLISTTGVAGWFWILSHIPPDPTRVTNLQDVGTGSLRWAVDNAPPESTITFDTSLSGTILLSSGDLNFSKDLTVRGPGASILSISGQNSGYGVHVGINYSFRGPGASILSISGQNSGYSVQVLSGTNDDLSGSPYPTVSISGLTLKNSHTSLYNDGLLNLINSTVLDSGDIVNDGTLTLTNSTVSDKSGINNDGTLTLINSTLTNGGVNNSYNGTYATLTLTHSTIKGGDIVNNSNGTSTLINSTVSDNTISTGTGGHGRCGGGIVNDGTLTLTNSTVSDNKDLLDARGGGYGGGICNNGSLTLTNSTVSDNYADGNGGGILNDGKLTLTNSTVSGNTTGFGEGGGIDNGGKLTITSSTISGNTTAGKGSDISTGSAASTSSQLTIRNSIVGGDPDHPGPDVVGMLTSNGFNLFQDNSGATFDPATSTQQGIDMYLSVNNLSTLFADKGKLQYNGGPTETLALAPDSLAVDQIPLNACHINGITSDQRGMKRPDANEDKKDMNKCDIGAYEYQDPPA